LKETVYSVLELKVFKDHSHRQESRSDKSRTCCKLSKGRRKSERKLSTI